MFPILRAPTLWAAPAARISSWLAFIRFRDLVNGTPARDPKHLKSTNSNNKNATTPITIPAISPAPIPVAEEETATGGVKVAVGVPEDVGLIVPDVDKEPVMVAVGEGEGEGETDIDKDMDAVEESVSVGSDEGCCVDLVLVVRVKGKLDGSCVPLSLGESVGEICPLKLMLIELEEDDIYGVVRGLWVIGTFEPRILPLPSDTGQTSSVFCRFFVFVHASLL